MCNHHKGGHFSKEERQQSWTGNEQLVVGISSAELHHSMIFSVRGILRQQLALVLSLCCDV